PPAIEPPEIDVAVAVPLGPQKPGDQKAADEEEDGDAEAARNQAAEAEMAEDDDGDRNGPEAIQSGDVVPGRLTDQRPHPWALGDTRNLEPMCLFLSKARWPRPHDGSGRPPT